MKQVTFDPTKCANSSAVLAMLCEKHPKEVVHLHSVNWADCTVIYETAKAA